MEVVEISEEPDAVGHETHSSMKMADNGVLLAKVKEFLVEEICKEYLTALEENVEANRTSDQIIDVDNAGCHEDFMDANLDPQYKLFLSNLREHESSFMVEFSASDRVSSCLQYEADDGTYDKSPSNVVENRKSRAVRNGKSLHTSSASKRSRRESVKEDHKSIERRNEELRASRTVPVVGTGDAQQGKRDVQRRRKISAVNKNAELKAKSRGSYQWKSCSPRQQNSKALACKNTVVKDEVIEDDSYKVYLTWLEHRNENPNTIPEKGLEVKRETGTESSCDSDIIAVGDQPFSDEEYSPFVPAKNFNAVDVDGKDDGPVGVSNSWFRKELMNILRKPYNQTEFFNLYCDVSIRKNITRERELRDGREISYETDILGDSYLDKYPDFRDLFIPWVGSTDFKDFLKLPVKYRHRALNLLRGFFYYLKNVVHEGAFKPWLDNECLKTLPSM